MEGRNFVELQGKIMWPTIKTVGNNNYKLFKSKLAIPIEGRDGKFQYLKIAAWQATAEALADLTDETFIKLHGHIEERSYEGKCKSCDTSEKKYWTEVVVDNFIIVQD